MGCSSSSVKEETDEVPRVAIHREDEGRPIPDDKLHSWEFNLLEVKEEDVIKTIYSIIEYWDLRNEYSVTNERLSNFIRAVESNYHNNP